MPDEIHLPLADGGTCTVRRECLIISRIPAAARAEESGSLALSEGDASWTWKFAELKGRLDARLLAIVLISMLSTYAIAKLMKLEVSGVKVEEMVAVLALFWSLYIMIRLLFSPKSVATSDSETPLIQREELLRLEWLERELVIHYQCEHVVKIRRLRLLDRHQGEIAFQRLSWL